ncbi:MAG: alpha-1,2-fucosyltransferase [Candidatus Paceibacterota bacterium]
MMISCNLMHLLCPPQSTKDTGMGNTLFQIATMYALSRDYDFEMNFYELAQYCNILKKFGLDHDQKIFKYIFEKYDSNNKSDNFIKLIEGEKYPVEQFLDTNFLTNVKDNKDKNIQIEGYFQSHLYFDKYRNDILDLFKIDYQSLELIKHKYPILFDTNKTCICIHVRMNYGSINYNLNYFQETINYFEQKFSNIHFMVFSNNIESISNWFNDSNKYTYVTGNIDYIDLWIMSLCKHNIITHSTFSWWGAYLNNNPDKIITFPTETLRISACSLYPYIMYGQRLTEYYMPNWVGFNTNTLVN